MMDTSTSGSDFANEMVSSKRQRYKSITAGRGRLLAKRVFTKPGRGALAMTTSAQSRLFEGFIVAPRPVGEGALALSLFGPAISIDAHAAKSQARRRK